MKKVTGVMLSKRDIGTVLSCTYTDIDEETGEIKSSNNARSKLLMTAEDEKAAKAIFDLAQNLAEAEHV